MEIPDVIILRGAPGSGKSQTAKAFSHYCPKGIRLEVDTLRNMVISVDWINQKEHIQLLEVAVKLTRQFLQRKFKPVIVVDTFSGNKLERFLKNLQGKRKKTITTKIVSLYCSDEELKQRLKSRIKNEFRDLEISKEINTLTQNVNYENEIKIDTTGLISEQTARMILENRNDQTCCKIIV